MLKAFENGADGVMVVGCLEGDCHYMSGDIRARARVERVHTILEQINIGADRIKMYNLSAGEGAKFAEFANEFVGIIEELGPSPINVARAGAPKETVPQEEVV